jgi:hypothetical protein
MKHSHILISICVFVVIIVSIFGLVINPIITGHAVGAVNFAIIFENESQKDSGGGNGGGGVRIKTPIEEEPKLASEESEIPDKLFDITWNLDDLVIQRVDELVGVITFESFGKVPTYVDLTFIVLNNKGEVVYGKKGNITVMTEEVMRWKFAEKGLNVLPEGKYTAILEILYNIDVFDEFKQKFTVGAEKKEINLLVWIVGGIVFIILIIIFLLWFILKRKKKKKNLETHIKFKKRIGKNLKTIKGGKNEI